MRHRWSTALAVLVLALAGVGASNADDDAKAKEELEKLQGTWTVESVVSGRTGQEFPTERVKALEWRCEIKGDEFRFLAKGKMNGVPQTIRLNSDRSPKEIDTTATEGPNKGKPARGIYELDGDTLKLRKGSPTLPRPSSMESKGTFVGDHILIMKRTK